jgi:ketosteroid isomerase-like protein
MKKINFIQLLLFLFVCTFTYSIFGCKHNNPDFVKETYKEKQEQIAKDIEDIFQAGKSKDFKKLKSYHLNSPKFTKFEGGNPTRFNFEENNKGEEGSFSAVDEFNYKINDLQVDVFDKVAIATFMFAFDAKIQGTRLVDTSHTTLVFIETEGKWKITHEHFSKYK